jgi:hypothetical protein
MTSLLTRSKQSIISEFHLRRFFPSFVLKPTSLYIRGITGHSVPVLGTTKIPILDEDSRLVDCLFLLTNSGSSILGLTLLKLLKIQFSLVSPSDYSNSALKHSINRCSEATGGRKLSPVKLETTGEQRRLIHNRLRENARDIPVMVELSQRASSTLSPQKSDVNHGIKYAEVQSSFQTAMTATHDCQVNRDTETKEFYCLLIQQGQVVQNSVGSAKHNEILSGDGEPIISPREIRRSIQWQFKPRQVYKRPELHLTCGECDNWT